MPPKLDAPFNRFSKFVGKSMFQLNLSLFVYLWAILALQLHLNSMLQIFSYAFEVAVAKKKFAAAYAITSRYIPGQRIFNKGII